MINVTFTANLPGKMGNFQPCVCLRIKMLECSFATVANIILGVKRSSYDKPTKERGTQECPVLIPESPQKKASCD